MERKEYSAGAVKMSFWFIEFRKVVQLLHDGKSMDEIKALAQSENILQHQPCCAPIRFIVQWPENKIAGSEFHPLLPVRRPCDTETLCVDCSNGV